MKEIINKHGYEIYVNRNKGQMVCCHTLWHRFPASLTSLHVPAAEKLSTRAVSSRHDAQNRGGAVQWRFHQTREFFSLSGVLQWCRPPVSTQDLWSSDKVTTGHICYLVIRAASEHLSECDNSVFPFKWMKWIMYNSKQFNSSDTVLTLLWQSLR